MEGRREGIPASPPLVDDAQSPEFSRDSQDGRIFLSFSFVKEDGRIFLSFSFVPT
jgi:hypothetical protein